jgi:hypothetical protein
MTKPKIKFANLPVAEREDHLKASCLTHKEIEVKRTYSSEELDEFREVHFKVNFEIDENKEKMAEASEPFKVRISTLKEQADEYYHKVKSGYEIVPKLLYLFPNHEDGVMEFYDEDGVCQQERPLTTDERQMRFPTVPPQKKA